MYVLSIFRSTQKHAGSFDLIDKKRISLFGADIFINRPFKILHIVKVRPTNRFYHSSRSNGQKVYMGNDEKLMRLDSLAIYMVSNYHDNMGYQ